MARRPPRRLAGTLLALLATSCMTVPPGTTTRAVPIDDPTALLLYAVGDIANCARHPPAESAAHSTAELVTPGAPVLALGDIAYPFATSERLQSCFEPTWGRHRATTYLVAGNHDYVSGSTRDVREYFQLDPTVDPRFVAYSRWLSPVWFVIVLDSNASGETLDEQYAWLQQTLLREFGPAQPGTLEGRRRCIMAAWHAPLFSSGLHHGSGAHMQRFWTLLDDYGADLLLSGHEHFYEAFEPMNSAGVRQPEGAGMRQFVVGTGGAMRYGFFRPPYTSRSRVYRHGVLELGLRPDGYSWAFIATDGKTYDPGAAPCRGVAGEAPGPRLPGE